MGLSPAEGAAAEEGADSLHVRLIGKEVEHVDAQAAEAAVLLGATLGPIGGKGAADGCAGGVDQERLPRYRDFPPSTDTWRYRVTTLSRLWKAGNSTPETFESAPSEALSVTLGAVTLSLPGGGTLATLHFLVRPGSAAMVASLALADLSLREETMTANLAFAETTTPTSGLVRPLSTTADCAGRLTEGATLSSETDAATGLTTYRLATNAASSPTVSAGEVVLSKAESGITAIVAQGPQEAIELAIDLGLEPEVSREGSTLTAAFALPTLTVTAFEPETGTITVCVTPGAGAKIAKTPAETPSRASSTSVAPTPSAAPGSPSPTSSSTSSAYQLNPGKITLFAQFGSHTFLKVTVGRVSAEDPAAP